MTTIPAPSAVGPDLHGPPASFDADDVLRAVNRALLDGLYLGLVVVDAELRIVVWNRFLELHSGRSAAQVLGKVVCDCFPDVPRAWLERRLRGVFRVRHSAFSSWRERPFLFRFSDDRAFGAGREPMRQDCGFFPVCNEAGAVTHVAITVADATASYLSHRRLSDALEEVRTSSAQLAEEAARRDRAEAELRRIHRMEAVGQLASGVAHEINTPLQFLSDNAAFLSGAVDDLLAGVNELKELIDETSALPGAASRRERADAIVQRADVQYLSAAAPQSCRGLSEGVARVAGIVAALKELTRAEGDSFTPLDVNAAVKHAATLADSKVRAFADLELDLTDLPSVEGDVGAIGQALLELVVNAVEAIGRAQATDGAGAGGADRPRGLIRIRTRPEATGVMVSVADNGGGIPADLHQKIFDPFYSTKPVGDGTGHGLAMVQSVVAKHKGQLTFTSELGRGTTFHVTLPFANRP